MLLKKKKIIIDDDEETMPQTKQIITKLSLPKLQSSNKKTRFSEIQKLTNQCPICYDSFSTNKKFVQIDPCNHLLCKDCLIQWASTYKSNCPICRQNFTFYWPLDSNLRKMSFQVKINPPKSPWQQEFDDFYYESEEEDQSDNYCMECLQTNNIYLMIICDYCNKKVCHCYCDDALHDNIPQGNWYCFNCRKSRLEFNKIKRFRRSQSSITRNQRNRWSRF